MIGVFVKQKTPYNSVVLAIFASKGTFSSLLSFIAKKAFVPFITLSLK
jgi:hypothetical protein